MNWWTSIGTLAAAFFGAIGGYGVGVKLLGDWWLEKVKAHHSEEMAEIAHLRTILLDDRRNAFSMGSSSHMAEVLFDKHIGFCEEYVEAMSNTLYTLIQEGKKDDTLDTGNLFGVRRKWALWLSKDIESKLDRFERKIIIIGADAQVWDENGPLSKDHSIKQEIAELRDILGIEELTNLRHKLVKDSAKKPTPVP
jgi:hypothetical protein